MATTGSLRVPVSKARLLACKYQADRHRYVAPITNHNPLFASLPPHDPSALNSGERCGRMPWMTSSHPTTDAAVNHVITGPSPSWHLML